MTGKNTGQSHRFPKSSVFKALILVITEHCQTYVGCNSTTAIDQSYQHVYRSTLHVLSDKGPCGLSLLAGRLMVRSSAWILKGAANCNTKIVLIKYALYHRIRFVNTTVILTNPIVPNIYSVQWHGFIFHCTISMDPMHHGTMGVHCMYNTQM